MSGSPVKDSNRAVIERFLAAFAARDVAGQFGCMHADVEIVEPDSLPYGGTWRGHEGWRSLGRAILATFRLHPNPDGHLLIGAEDGEDLALKTRLVGTWKETGRPFDMRILEHWHVVGGQIVRIQPHYFDTATALGWTKEG